MKTKEVKKNENPVNHFSLMNQLNDIYKKSQEVRQQIEVQKQERQNGRA